MIIVKFLDASLYLWKGDLYMLVWVYLCLCGICGCMSHASVSIKAIAKCQKMLDNDFIPTNHLHHKTSLVKVPASAIKYSERYAVHHFSLIFPGGAVVYCKN